MRKLYRLEIFGM